MSVNNIKTDYIIAILSITPIIGVIIQDYVSIFLNMNFNSLWIITIALNVSLAIYDSEFLKNNGQYSQKMGNPMLIPVYIYKRAKILNSGLMYFFIWCSSFILVSIVPSWRIVDVLL